MAFIKLEISNSRGRAAEEAARMVLDGAGFSKGSALSLDSIKKLTGRKYALAKVLKNSEILQKIPKEKRTAEVMARLRLRKVRTLSGLAPIAVMTLSDCPHGRCTYCPRGQNSAQSYTGYEPASMRGRQNNFDSYAQVSERLTNLQEIGHDVDKCELIIMGGTFNWQPREYQLNFIKGCLDAMNGGERSKTLEEALRRNETAPSRAVGITYETRPDWAREKNVDDLLLMGATRVELGVQTLSDAVYKKVHREHTVADVVHATRVLRDSALKVGYHMMPGLWADEKKDVAMFRRLFSDEKFRPDMLKIYPCLVLEGTGLYAQWKRGEFVPYDSEKAADVVAKASKYIAPYCRVMRMQRDIPAHLIAAGVKAGNLRQLVEARMKELDIECRCIRCREMGLQRRKLADMKIELRRLDYGAGGGKEIFLSYEEKDGSALAGFIRLRIPNSPHRPEITPETVLIRELHVYGQAMPIGESAVSNEGENRNIQDRGFGGRLIAEAERIARDEFGMGRMVIISGVGAREYYRKFGYANDGPYVSRKI